MRRQPGGDIPTWEMILAHRPAEMRAELGDRLAAAGLRPDAAWRALCDGGDDLYAAARSGDMDWADRFGGPLAVALLAAEVSALAAHLNSRASAVRALAVDSLLGDFSAVAVAARIGVSRQKVYDISRSTLPRFIDRTPWSQQ